LTYSENVPGPRNIKTITDRGTFLEVEVVFSSSRSQERCRSETDDERDGQRWQW